MRTTTPRRAHIALALLVSLAPAIVPQLAFAQAAPATDPTIVAARARFAEGVQFFDKGEFENARASFLQAYALHKHPAVLINLAQSSLRSGHALDAARDFARYMHDSPSLTPAQRAEAEKGLAEARQKLGRIDVSAPSGTAVTVDGDLAGTDGSTTWDVEPGSHTVKGAGDSVTLTVAAGQTAPVKLGKGVATPIPTITPLPPEPTTAPPAEPGPPPPEVTPTPQPVVQGHYFRPKVMWPVWVGAGAAAVGFGGAIVWGVVLKGNAQSSYSTEESQIIEATSPHQMGACNNPTQSQLIAGCQALSSDASAVSGDAAAANTLLVLGIAGAAFSLGWYLFAPKLPMDGNPSGTASNAPAFQVAPLIGPQLRGMSVGGQF